MWVKNSDKNCKCASGSCSAFASSSCALYAYTAAPTAPVTPVPITTAAPPTPSPSPKCAPGFVIVGNVCSACESNALLCGEQCVQASRVCDGSKDCANNDDERSCGWPRLEVKMNLDWGQWTTRNTTEFAVTLLSKMNVAYPGDVIVLASPGSVVLTFSMFTEQLVLNLKDLVTKQVRTLSDYKITNVATVPPRVSPPTPSPAPLPDEAGVSALIIKISTIVGPVFGGCVGIFGVVWKLYFAPRTLATAMEEWTSSFEAETDPAKRKTLHDKAKRALGMRESMFTFGRDFWGYEARITAAEARIDAAEARFDAAEKAAAYKN